MYNFDVYRNLGVLLLKMEIRRRALRRANRNFNWRAHTCARTTAARERARPSTEFRFGRGEMFELVDVHRRYYYYYYYAVGAFRLLGRIVFFLLLYRFFTDENAPSFARLSNGRVSRRYSYQIAVNEPSYTTTKTRNRPSFSKTANDILRGAVSDRCSNEVS